MKTLLLISLSLLTITPLTKAQAPPTPKSRIPQAGDIQQIKGTLQFLQKGEQQYFTVNLPIPLRALSEKGTPLVVRSIQLAGLNEDQWQYTKSLTGKEVVAQGRLMQAHTPYHYTPLLLITSSILEEKP